MKRWTLTSLVGMTGLALLGWAAIAAGEKVWVSAEGHRHHLHGEGHAVVIGDGATEFDVSELADGETRVIGEGPKQITASRTGDEVTLRRAANGEDAEMRVVCRLPADHCKILTFADDAEKVVVIVEKRRECVDGVGDCEAALDEDLVEGGHRVIVRRIVECDEDGNCEESEEVTRHGDVAGHAIVRMGQGIAGERKLVVIDDGNTVSLRCPEGDTKMRVDKQEAAEVFLCPKHSLPLEQVDGPAVEKKIFLRKTGSAEQQ